MSDEKDQPEDSKRKRALIEVLTENGFYIVRSSDLEKTLPDVPYEYLFIVRAPSGEERNVTVRFSHEAIALIQRRRRVPLMLTSSCWINCAERTLAKYLAEKNHLPLGAKLILEELSLDEMEALKRWNDGPKPYAETNLKTGVKTNILGTSFYLQSILVILFLYLIAAFAPKILAPNLTSLRDSLSSFILYAAIFLSGTLLGLGLMDLTPASAFLKAPETEERATSALSSYDEKGLTPVERVIARS